MQTTNENLTLYIVSDSIGETAMRMAHATLTQFPDLEEKAEIKNFHSLKVKRNF